MQYEINLGSDRAYLEYRWHAGDIALMHTLVPEEFEGKGIAGLLAKTALEDACQAGQKIIVYCPFVKSYIKRHPEYAALERKS